VDRVKQSTFAIPMILAALTLFGLLFALFLDGIWHVPAWIALSAPVLAIAWALRAAKKSGRSAQKGSSH